LHKILTLLVREVIHDANCNVLERTDMNTGLGLWDPDVACIEDVIHRALRSDLDPVVVELDGQRVGWSNLFDRTNVDARI